MKKIALFVSVLLLSAALFAEAPVFEAKPAISGDATMTFGIDLDAKASGITNATSTNLTLNLVTKASDEKGGKDGEVVYGWIKLKDFEMKVDGTLSVSKPGIEAKLFLGPVYINILGDGASTAKTLVNGILNDKDTNGVWDVLGLKTTTAEAKVEYKNLDVTEDKGLVIGLTDTSIVDVQIGASSLYSYSATSNTDVTTSVVTLTSPVATADANVWYVNQLTGAATQTPAPGVYTKIVFPANAPANVNNVYNFWTAVALKAVPGLTLEVKAGLTTNTPAANFPIGLGVKAGYEIAIAEGIKVTPTVAFDTVLASTLAYRLSAGATLSLPGSTLDDWDKFGTKQDIKPGLSVLWAMDSATTPNMDMSVAFFDGDLIPVVNLVAVGEFMGLTATTSNIGIGAFATADLGVVSPYAGFQTTMAGSTMGKTLLQIGADLKVITNTTFTLAYKSGDLTPAAPATAGLGTLTFAAKIAY